MSAFDKVPADLRDLLLTLSSALSRLKPEQSPGIRRRVRSEVRATLRDMSDEVDNFYPPPSRKVGRRRVQGQDREARLRGKGYLRINPTSALLVASAGIKVVLRGRSDGSTEAWVPAWTVAFNTKAALIHAKKDLAFRKAGEVELLLGGKL